MSDSISFLDNSLINEKIQIVMRQTDYTEEKALQKLEDLNYDHILVIKDYFGIPFKKVNEIKSVNQEIYRQIRYKLNDSLKEYNEKNPVDVNKIINNLKQSEEKENNKKK